MSTNQSALEFPCDFPIKAMGLNHQEFELSVVQLIRNHAEDLNETAVSSRPSKSNKYLSVTVTIRARSQQQLDAIYQDLTHCEAVIMAL